jgi:hypothetical protein
MHAFSISTSMNDNPWSTDPEQAYANWWKEEAAVADRRPFAEQSIVQHRAMFARIHRYLAGHRQTVATFGVDHVDGFFQEISADCAPGTTIHIRYLKLIDRFSRHLVAIGERKDNPAAEMLIRWTWPEDEPVPVYLALDNDKRLQAACRPIPDQDLQATSKHSRGGAIFGYGNNCRRVPAAPVGRSHRRRRAPRCICRKERPSRRPKGPA